MADLGNQLEGAGSGLERLTEGFDNLVLKLSGVSALEARIIKEKQAINKQLNKIDKDKIREEKKALPLQKKMTIQLQQRLKNTTLLNKGLKETVKGMKLFEKGMGGLRSSMGNMGKGMAKMGAAAGKAGAIGGLVIAVKFLIDGLLKVDKAMADLSKRTNMTRQELSGVKDAAIAAEMQFKFMGVGLEHTTAEAANLVEQFGRADMVTAKLIKNSLDLQKGYGLTAQAAGQLTEALERTQRAGDDFRQSVHDIAGKAGVSASLVMRDLASRSQQIAIQNERGTDALIRMAVEAAKAGQSLDSMQGMKSAFSDIDGIAEGLGSAAAIMGEDWAAALGNAESLYELNLRGAKGREIIQKRIMKAMDATVRVNEKGELVHKRSGKLLGDMEGYMERVAASTGLTNEHLQMQFREYKKINTEADILLTENERLQQVYKDNKTILELFGDIATGVFAKVSTTFSDAIGLDSTKPGSVRETIATFSDFVYDQMGFPQLSEKTKGKGLKVFFETLWRDSLQPLFSEMGRFLGQAIANGISDAITDWKRSSGWADWLLPDTEKENLLEDIDDLRARVDKGTRRTGQRGQGRSRKFTEDEKLALQTQLAEMETAAGLKGTKAQGAVAAAARQKERAQLSKEAQGFGITDPTQIKEYVDNLATLNALGGVHRRGRPALVGEEGRGEVVISRSALRSGVGVGGRAASALAGIGVPGFREGYARADLSGVHGRQGLMGAQGSQSFRSARASAFQAEQARQQAAMMEYWRQHYEDKMDDMVDEKAKGKEPPWLAKFFLKHNKQIGAVLNKTLGKKAFGKEMTAAIMQGMTNWSKGGSLKDSLRIGIKAGVVAGLNDPDSSLNKFLQQQGAMGNVAKAGLAAFASGKNVKRAVVSTGARELASYIQGGGTFGFGKPKKAAKGQYVNSPTLMMVGEEGRGEVVVPTERIRKGLPINKGVANELASIGVPGFDGKNNSTMATWTPSTGEYSLGSKPNTIGGQSTMLGVDTSKQGQGSLINIPNNAQIGAKPGQSNLAGANRALLDSGKTGGSWEGKQNLDVMTPGSQVSSSIKGTYAGGVSRRFEGMGGWGGMAKGAAVGGLMDFANVYEQTGDWKQAASAGVGAGIGAAAGMGLTALGVPPPLSTMIGGAVGKLATRGINKVFKITGGYGECRKRVMKLMESHIKSGGRFDFGAPSGLNKAMGQAIGGYEKTPTEANFNKMVEKMGTSSLIASMGVPAPALIALAQGKMNGGAAAKVYKTINTSLYGSGADKYRKALAIPALASGGVVNKPTTALIGERGPEAVVPLGDSEMMKELKKQNKLMEKMIKTQEETGNPEIRLDGRVVSEVVGQNFYDIGNGM